MAGGHKKTRVIVPGTFDPITAGHLDIITRATMLFDEIVVGVAVSETKGVGPLFSLEDRVSLAVAATAHLESVTVKSFDGLLVDFAHSEDASAIVKGLRVVTDFESEYQQAALNYRLSPDIETVLIMSSPDHMYLSSSVVKEIARLKGDISGLVPDCVGYAVQDRFGCIFHAQG